MLAIHTMLKSRSDCEIWAGRGAGAGLPGGRSWFGASSIDTAVTVYETGPATPPATVRNLAPTN